MAEYGPNVRRTVLIKESVPIHLPTGGFGQLVRAAGIVIIENPFLNLEGDDFSQYHPLGEWIGDYIMGDIVDMLPAPPCGYGKATLIGQLGNPEHGAALMHPTLGKPIRAAIGGGEVVIPSNVKVGAIDASIDVPISHKDDMWSFDHLDTMPIRAAESPKPDEIMVIIALTTGKRPSIKTR